MKVLISKEICEHDYFKIKQGMTVYILSINGYTNTVLCDQYLNYSIQEYHKIAKKYNGIIVGYYSSPMFLDLKDVQKFVDEWVYPRLVMNQLVNNIEEN